MPTDKKSCSVQIGFSGWKAIAQITSALAKLGKQADGAQKVSNEFGRFNVAAHKTMH
jgi:hypothetical protein